MDFKELILKRRSLRAYDEGGMPSKEEMAAMVEAALEAPSWKHSQTGRYYCVNDEDMLSKLRDGILLSHNPDVSKNAAMIVSTYIKDRSGYLPDGTPDNEAGNLWGAYDLGLQNENLVLMAKDMGYDTLIMGLRDEPKLRALLSIPENEIILPVIAVGKGSKEASRPKRKAVDAVAKFY